MGDESVAAVARQWFVRATAAVAISAAHTTAEAPLRCLRMVHGPAPSWEALADQAAESAKARGGYRQLWRHNTWWVAFHASQFAPTLLCTDAALRAVVDASDGYFAGLAKSVAGASAGAAAATLLLYPAQRVFERVWRPVPSLFPGGWRREAAALGIAGLYTGATVGVARGVASFGVTYGVFGHAQARNPARDDCGWVGLASATAALVIASTVSAPLAYPLNRAAVLHAVSQNERAAEAPAPLKSAWAVLRAHARAGTLWAGFLRAPLVPPAMLQLLLYDRAVCFLLAPVSTPAPTSVV